MISEFGVICAAFGFSVAAFTACWIYGLRHDGDISVTDAYYGLAAMAHGILTLVIADRYTVRGVILVALASAWSLGLGQFLFRRWRRHHSAGGDARYLLAIEKLNPGRSLWWKTFLSLVLAQAVLVTVLNLPLQLAIMSDFSGLTVLDVIGLLIVAAGGLIEVLANHQLEVFKRDPANKGKTLMRSLWSWSRHPNYFGNVAVCTGFVVVAVRDPALWWTIVSPVVMYGLLRYGTGVRLTDWMMLQKRAGDPEYIEYLRRTSPFMLRPPKRPQAIADQRAPRPPG